MSALHHEESRATPHASPAAPGGEAALGHPVASAAARSRFPVAYTQGPGVNAPEVDAGDDRLPVPVPDHGEPLVVTSPDFALDRLLGRQHPSALCPGQGEVPDFDKTEPLPKGIRLTALDRQGRTYEGTCSCLTSTRLFIEMPALPAAGTTLDLVLILPGTPGPSRRATGIVTWVCPGPDEFGFAQGVGVALVGHLADDIAVPLEAGRLSERRSVTKPA